MSYLTPMSSWSGSVCRVLTGIHAAESDPELTGGHLRSRLMDPVAALPFLAGFYAMNVIQFLAAAGCNKGYICNVVSRFRAIEWHRSHWFFGKACLSYLFFLLVCFLIVATGTAAKLVLYHPEDALHFWVLCGLPLIPAAVNVVAFMTPSYLLLWAAVAAGRRAARRRLERREAEGETEIEMQELANPPPPENSAAEA